MIATVSDPVAPAQPPGCSPCPASLHHQASDGQATFGEGKRPVDLQPNEAKPRQPKPAGPPRGSVVAFITPRSHGLVPVPDAKALTAHHCSTGRRRPQLPSAVAAHAECSGPQPVYATKRRPFPLRPDASKLLPSPWLALQRRLRTELQMSWLVDQQVAKGHAGGKLWGASPPLPAGPNTMVATTHQAWLFRRIWFSSLSISVAAKSLIALWRVSISARRSTITRSSSASVETSRRRPSWANSACSAALSSCLARERSRSVRLGSFIHPMFNHALPAVRTRVATPCFFQMLRSSVRWRPSWG